MYGMCVVHVFCSVVCVYNAYVVSVWCVYGVCSISDIHV